MKRMLTGSLVLALLLAAGPVRAMDADAAAYIALVEAADGESLEYGVKKGIDDFVVGCKSDGIWDAIKAACILAGARTLNGALVPLKGTAPTSYNFVDGDYDRTTGLKGDGSSKYLNSNRNNNADPQNSHHMSVHFSSASLINRAFISARGDSAASGASELGISEPATTAFQRSRSYTTGIQASFLTSGFYGTSRSSSANYLVRCGGSTRTITVESQTPLSASIYVFARNGASNAAAIFTDARISFYSIGEAIDLAKLDARVTTLIATIADPRRSRSPRAR